LIEEKKLAQAQEILPAVYKKLDKAAKVDLIKKNKAARLKSRLAKQLQPKTKSVKAEL
jgi:ribosomal protein S20